MKNKIAFALSGLLFAGFVNAAGTVLPVNKKLDQVDCPLLNEDVQLTLSTNVVAAYKCTAATNTILFAGCSTSGRVSSRTAMVDLPAGCGVAPAGGGAIVPCVATKQAVNGSVVSMAASTGGQLKQTFPGGTCAADGAVASSAIP